MINKNNNQSVSGQLTVDYYNKNYLCVCRINAKRRLFRYTKYVYRFVAKMKLIYWILAVVLDVMPSIFWNMGTMSRL